MERIVEVRDWFISARGGFFVFLLACLLGAFAHSTALAGEGCGKCGKPACSSDEKPCSCDSCAKPKACGCGECEKPKPCGCERPCEHWGCQGKCRECQDECGAPLPMKEGSCVTPAIPDQGCWGISADCCPQERYCLLCGERAEFKLLCCKKPKKCCPEKPKPCKCRECCPECQHLDISK